MSQWMGGFSPTLKSRMMNAAGSCWRQDRELQRKLDVENSSNALGTFGKDVLD